MLIEIKHNTVKFIGGANARIIEDPVKMLTIIKVATFLNLSLEKKSKEAIIDNVLRLKFADIEQVRDEFTSIITSKNASMGLKILKEVGILNFIMPNLRINELDMSTVRPLLIDRLVLISTKAFSVAVFKGELRRMKYNNKVVEKVCNKIKSVL